MPHKHSDNIRGNSPSTDESNNQANQTAKPNQIAGLALFMRFFGGKVEFTQKFSHQMNC